MPVAHVTVHFHGSRLRASFRCKVRLCMFSRRAASDTLPPDSVNTRCKCSHSTLSSGGVSLGSLLGPCPSKARNTSSADTGLVRYWTAPSFMAETALVIGAARGIGRAIAQRFVDEGAVAVLGTYASSHSIPAANVFQDEGVVMVSTGSTNPATTQIGDYIFRVPYTDQFQGQVAAQWAFNEADGERVAFVSNRDGDTELYLMEVASGSVTRLTQRADSDAHPAWLPDGRIVYVARVEGQRVLRWLDPEDPSETHDIPTGAGEVGNPAALD